VRAILITIILIVVSLDVASRIWTSTNEAPNSAFTSLMRAPAPTLHGPRTNGYLLFLGFATAPSEDAVQMGHDMWLEAASEAGHGYFDYDNAARLALRVRDGSLSPAPVWGDQDPLALLGGQENALRSVIAQEDVLLKRYQQWLTMPFEDWGLGKAGAPRAVEIFAVHRLYLIEGLGQEFSKTVERAERDLTVWRTVLAQAKSLPVKMLAAAVIDDDVAVVSGLLKQRAVNLKLVARLAQMVRPLSESERSLRWPIQHEFMLGVQRYSRQFTEVSPVNRQASDEHKHWIAMLARLKPEAFKHVEQPGPPHPLAKTPGPRERALNSFANYYTALTRATETPNMRLPKMGEFMRVSEPSPWEYVLSPIDSVLSGGFSPAWEPFIHRLQETEAKLRLVSLQARLRQSSRIDDIPSRIAQAGPSLYDPFTGLPMLWSPSQRKLYSVGKDGLDDGGEPTFDVSLSLVGQPIAGSPKVGKGKPDRMKPQPTADQEEIAEEEAVLL
jgi:hypothetical protein